MNAGLVVDLPQLAESGAEGIGLFRTELQFMIASTMPKADEQEAFYRTVLKQAGDRTVTFRTLDIGGDKVVPYFRAHDEENPALGWRAIRLSLDRPGLLRTQLRAMLRAAADGELKMMVPMVTEVSEIATRRVCKPGASVNPGLTTRSSRKVRIISMAHIRSTRAIAT